MAEVSGLGQRPVVAWSESTLLREKNCQMISKKQEISTRTWICRLDQWKAKSDNSWTVCPFMEDTFMSKITQIIKEARDQGDWLPLDFAQKNFNDLSITWKSKLPWWWCGRWWGWTLRRSNGYSRWDPKENLQDNLKRQFWATHPEGYRKALRLMKLKQKKFGLIPVGPTL